MKLKTEEIVSAYKTLSNAKVTKMSLEDKMKVAKSMCVLKPFSDDFEQYLSTINEKLKDDKYEEMTEKAKTIDSGNKDNLSLEEQQEVNEYFAKYNKDIAFCINEELSKEVEVDVPTISYDALCNLVESNDFTCSQISVLLATIVSK